MSGWIVPFVRYDAALGRVPPAGSVPTPGMRVLRGASAYEVAVANGYEGTAVEWLASLHGAAGTDGQDGTDGAPGSDGADGAAGASAYQVAVANGYVGTAVEWLASLVGADGAPGAPGTPGADGSDGESAYQVAVAAGFVGTEEQWLASLVGADGAPGQDFTPGKLAPHDEWMDASAYGTPDPFGPYEAGSISSGTRLITGTMPGSIGGKVFGGFLFRGSATANGGYRFLTNISNIFFGSRSHKWAMKFAWKTLIATTVRAGFHDRSTMFPAYHGVLFEQIDGFVVGVASSSGIRSLTPAFGLVQDKPYFFEIDVDAAGTAARFRISDIDSGLLVFDETVTTNIPGAGQLCGPRIVATCSNTASTDIGALYYMGHGSVAGYERVRG